MTASKHSRTLFIGSIAALALAAPLAGCGGASECVEPLAADVSNPIVTPLNVHTGTDGANLFRVLIATNFGQLEWTSADEEVVDVQRIGCVQEAEMGDPDPRSTAVITAVNPGTTTVTGVSGEFTVDVDVVVESYTEEQYEAGRARYFSEDGGARQACANCHLGGPNVVPHSPDEISEFNDAELLLATTDGIYPDRCLAEGRRCSCTPDPMAEPGMECAACPEANCALDQQPPLDLGNEEGFGEGPHVWEVNAEEAEGIVAFMRGLAPFGF